MTPTKTLPERLREQARLFDEGPWGVDHIETADLREAAKLIEELRAMLRDLCQTRVTP